MVVKEETLLREIERLNKKVEELESELRFLKSKSHQITPDDYPKNTTSTFCKDFNYTRSTGEENGY